MGFFRREPNAIEKVDLIFQDEFSSWTIQHSTKLVNDLCRDESTKEFGNLIVGHNAETDLIDALTSAHLAVIKYSLPDGFLMLLGGEKNVATAVKAWPQQVQISAIHTIEFLNASAEKGLANTFTESLEKLYGAEKPLDKFSVMLAASIISTLANKIPDISGPFNVGILYGTIFKLKQETLDWFKMILEKAKSDKTIDIQKTVNKSNHASKF